MHSRNFLHQFVLTSRQWFQANQSYSPAYYSLDPRVLDRTTSHVAPVSIANDPDFRPHVSFSRDGVVWSTVTWPRWALSLNVTLRGNAHLVHLPAYKTTRSLKEHWCWIVSMPLTKVCLLCSFDVDILDLIHIFLDKQDQHYWPMIPPYRLRFPSTRPTIP